MKITETQKTKETKVSIIQKGSNDQEIQFGWEGDADKNLEISEEAFNELYDLSHAIELDLHPEYRYRPQQIGSIFRRMSFRSGGVLSVSSKVEWFLSVVNRIWQNKSNIPISNSNVIEIILEEFNSSHKIGFDKKDFIDSTLTNPRFHAEKKSILEEIRKSIDIYLLADLESKEKKIVNLSLVDLTFHEALIFRLLNLAVLDANLLTAKDMLLLCKSFPEFKNIDCVDELITLDIIIDEELKAKNKKPTGRMIRYRRDDLAKRWRTMDKSQFDQFFKKFTLDVTIPYREAVLEIERAEKIYDQEKNYPAEVIKKLSNPLIRPLFEIGLYSEQEIERVSKRIKYLQEIKEKRASFREIIAKL